MNDGPRLTDELLAERLAQSAAQSVAAAPDAETVALRAALQSYRVETLDWAERRSATQPSLAPRAKESPWAALPKWSLAAVALVAVTAGVVHVAGYGPDDVAPAASTPVASVRSATHADDIAADNQLLGSIDNALRYESVSPDSAFHARPAKQSGRASHTEGTD